MLWHLDDLPEFGRTLKQYEKKHAAEVAQLLVNLDAVHQALNLGAKPEALHGGHVHREPLGVIAVDQRGSAAKGLELRLYTYPRTATSTLYLLRIGEKASQQRDINWCRDWVKRLRQETDHES